MALGREDHFKVCATAANKTAVLNGIASEAADALLVDTAMPEAIDIIKTVAQCGCAIKVIALGVNEHPDAILSCAEAGISGYVSRDGSINQLIDTINSALRDEFICSPRIAALLLQQVSALSVQQVGDNAMQKLTPRERQVVILVSEGLSNKQIARRLNISVSTTKNHIHNILNKLEVQQRSEIMAISWRSGALNSQRPAESL